MLAAHLASLLASLMAIPAYAQELRLSAAAEAYRFTLEEFTVDATRTPVARRIECGPGELGEAYARGPRALRPSRDPTAGEAAWLLGGRTCESLRPYLNAIGIDFLDPASGRATIYLALILESAPGSAFRGEAAESLDPLAVATGSRFGAVNEIRFEAHCELVSGWRETNGVFYPDLSCTLDGYRGILRLSALPKE